MKDEMIRTKEELIEFFNFKRMGKCPSKAYVSSALRKAVMTSDLQSRFVQGGTVREFDFKNLGGGVYEVSVKNLVRSA